MTSPYDPLYRHVEACAQCAAGRPCAEGEAIMARCSQRAAKLIVPIPPITKPKAKA